MCQIFLLGWLISPILAHLSFDLSETYFPPLDYENSYIFLCNLAEQYNANTRYD